MPAEDYYTSVLGGSWNPCDIQHLEAEAIDKTARAIRITRGSLEVMLPLFSLRHCNNGGDVLKATAMQAVLDKSRIFAFNDNVKNSIYDDRKVVVKMAINDVEGGQGGSQSLQTYSSRLGKASTNSGILTI